MNSAGQVPMDFNRILDGMIRAAKLEVPFYAKVEQDPSYDQDALGVVVLASVAGAIGGFLGALFTGHALGAVITLIWTAIIGVLTYFVWAYLIYFVGTSLFKGTATFGEVRRTMGFAYAPRVLQILSFIPVLGSLIGFVVWLWMIATTFIATRQALNLDNTNAALTVIIAAVIVFVVTLILGLIFGAIALALGFAGAAIGGVLR